MTTSSLTAHPGNPLSTLPLDPLLTATTQPITLGQAIQLPTAGGNPQAAAQVTPSEQAPRPQPVVDGRSLERLLLNPQSIPEGEQRLLRQQLQQRLASSDVVAPNSSSRHQLVATLLAGADGLPLINPQLQQQLERKQTAAVANQLQGKPQLPGKPQSQAAQPAAAVLSEGRPRQRDPVVTSTVATGLRNGPQPDETKQLLLAIERALTGDPLGLQQLTPQLVIASQQERLPERHQLLVLAALLLDESDPPLTTLDPRARRRLSRQLLSALKSKQADQPSATDSVATVLRSSERLTGARQAITQGSVGERWSEEDEQSLPPELLWSGLGVAPATVKLPQVEAVLDALVDKSALGVANSGSLNAFISQASMDQLLMVVTTLMIKINNLSASFMVQSQKINAMASDKVMDHQLQKQIEEAQKAQEAQENANKGGIFNLVFTWIAAIATAVVAVISCNPVAIVGALALVAAAVIESIAFSMGDNAPEWMSKAVLGLTIAGSILSCGASLITSAFKAAGRAAKVVGAALKRVFYPPFKAICRVISKCVTKIIARLKNSPEMATKMGGRAKNFGKSPVDKLKEPIESSKQAGQATAEKGRELVAPGNRLETISMGAEVVNVGAITAKTVTGLYYEHKAAMLQAEIKNLQNECWLLDVLLEYYQKQRKALQQGMSDLYRQEGDAVAIASDLLKESAGLQNRIAGSLA